VGAIYIAAIMLFVLASHR